MNNKEIYTVNFGFINAKMRLDYIYPQKFYGSCKLISVRKLYKYFEVGSMIKMITKINI